VEADAARLKTLYQTELETWAKAELEARGGRRKTLPLMQGTVAFRTVPASIRVADPAAALEFARESGLPSCVREEIDPAAYREEAERRLLERFLVVPPLI